MCVRGEGDSCGAVEFLVLDNGHWWTAKSKQKPRKKKFHGFAGEASFMPISFAMLSASEARLTYPKAVRERMRAYHEDGDEVAQDGPHERSSEAVQHHLQAVRIWVRGEANPGVSIFMLRNRSGET